MIAVFALPAYVLLHAWILSWFLRWLRLLNPLFKAKSMTILTIIAYYFFCLSMYIAPLIPQGGVEKFFRVLGNYCFGMTIYLGIGLVVILIARFFVYHTKLRTKEYFFSKRTSVIIGALSIFLVSVIYAAGHYNATIIRTTNYELRIDKKCALEDLNIVLIADQHLGYSVGLKMMEQMVSKVNALNPDIVLVGGDIFDNCFENINNPEKIAETLRGIQSKYGVFAVLGNHDVEEPIVGGFTFNHDEKKEASDEMYDFLKKCNFKLLCDEYYLIADSIYIYGRPDEERPGKYVTDKRLSPSEFVSFMDTEKPIIVLEHEPKFLDELAENGVDLHLAGHTHDGQMFPLNIATSIMWENSYGLLKKNKMTSIVTSGVGVYGPYIRIGTKPEVCNIHMTFSE